MPSSFADGTGLRPFRTISALSILPPSTSGGSTFSGLSVRLCYNLSSCLPPLVDPTRLSPSRQRLLLPGFRRVGLPSRRRDMTTGGNWGKFHRRDFRPAGMAASIACTRNSVDRYTVRNGDSGSSRQGRGRWPHADTGQSPVLRTIPVVAAGVADVIFPGGEHCENPTRTGAGPGHARLPRLLGRSRHRRRGA